MPQFSMAQQLIKKLELIKHPEGGYYKEIFRSKDKVQASHERYQHEERSASTVIYYLLQGNDFSAWHRVNSDESWQYCAGCELTLYVIDSNRTMQTIIIGDPLIHANATYHFSIRNGLWFCAAPNDKQQYSLVTCTVAPGFDFKDWELAKRSRLLTEYPEHESLIKQFTFQG